MDLDTASPKEDAAIREVQEHDSPEGAPPPKRTRQRMWTILTICVVALTIATVAVLFLIDGPTAVAVGVAMTIGYGVVGGAVAIAATQQRATERHKIKDQVERRR
jgi:hypothetical protein